MINLIKKETIKKDVEEEYMVCDNCNNKIKEYGTTWYVLQHFTGQFRDNPPELVETHLCSDDCLNRFNDENR